MAEILTNTPQYEAAPGNEGGVDMQGFGAEVQPMHNNPPPEDFKGDASTVTNLNPLPSETLSVTEGETSVLDNANDTSKTHVLKYEAAETVLPDYEDDIPLPEMLRTEGSNLIELSNTEIASQLDEVGLEALHDIMHHVDTLQAMRVVIDNEQYSLPRDNTQTWGERLVQRAQEMQHFIGTWQELESKYGRTQGDIIIPGKEGLSFRVFNSISNTEMYTQVQGLDAKESRTLEIGHITGVFNPVSRHLTVSEMQKQSDATPVTSEEIEEKKAEFLEKLLRADRSNFPLRIATALQYFGSSYNQVDELNLRLYNAARDKGVDPHIIQALLYESVREPNERRGDKIIRKVRQAHGKAALEHISLSQFTEGIDAETVQIIHPRHSKWMDESFGLSEYGAGAIVATELGKRIKELPLEEHTKMMQFLQNYQNTENRQRDIMRWMSVYGMFPQDSVTNAIIEKRIKYYSLASDAPVRTIGAALLDAATMYLYDSPYREEILQGVQKTNVFAETNGDIYQGVGNMLGLDLPTFDITTAQADTEKYYHDIFSVQAREYALQSETYKQMFGGYEIPSDIAEPIAEDSRGKTYRASDLQAGIDQLKRK